MIRVLHSVSNMDRAGIETMLMNYYRNIDRTRFQFDFLCNKAKIGAYEEEIQKLGGIIYRTPGLNPLKFFKYKKFMKNVLSKYDIIHVHNGALGEYALYCAHKFKTKVRIFHAHGASISIDLKMPIKLFCKSRIKYDCNEKFACSTEAAKCYFGKSDANDNNFVYVRNAIDTSVFKFNMEKRNEIRKKYNLDNAFVIGHVGRFMQQKNHKYLIKIFYEVLKNHKNARLVLLGDGRLLSKIKKYSKKLRVYEKIIFLGNVTNVNEWYQAFDIFVMPSFWEGLPVVGIEAQCAGLKCIFSDKITKEVKVTDNVQFFSLKNKPTEWSKQILKNLDYKRIDCSIIVKENSYDIKNETIKLEKLYTDLIGEKK